MSSAGSISAPSSDGVIRSRVTEALQISGYHFTNAAHIPTTHHYDNVTLVNGYRVSDKRAVVAKVSNNSLQIEREYYIIRQLYQTADGPLYLVRPLEYAYLSTSGLAVAIYADAHSNRSSNRTIDDIGTFLRLAIRCTDIMESVHRHNTIHGQLNMEAFCWNSNDMDTTRLWNFSAGSSTSFEKYLTSEGWKKYQKSQAIMMNRLMIIINLLGNAVKFTHHGEISIRCSIDRRKKKAVDKGTHVPLLFEVIDTGIGISEEQRKVLFMPFSQVDGSTTRKYGGTGLGLSICLQLVSLMNGDIDVVSETGKGSNFRFSIQVSPVHDQSRRLTEAMQAISKSFINTRVLVADTHHATVDMMTNFLPNLPLDGVSDYAELQQETPYGVVIVGLLLDHKEGTLSNWENELQKIMKRAKVTVIMHYPLGTSNVQGNIGGVGPILEAASSSVEQEQQRQRQQQPFHISSYGHLDEQQNIVRMGVPLRRNKLLKMLAGFLKEDVPGTPAPKSRPSIFARVSSSEIKLAIETMPEEHRKAFKKTNILVAEDNPVAQKLLCKQLKRYGFNITCANNGAEAIAAWTKRPVGYFKMALFDHHMPKCDGVEATKTIRRNEKEQNMKKRLPIVALTADIQDSARAICVNAGMDGYLTKPLNEFALLEFVKQYCIDQ